MFNSQSIAIFFKGVAMGISDLIPGISGGTIALLLGIYKNFIDSLKSINHKSLIYLLSFNFNKLDNQINLKFLIPVLLGIIFSIFSFSSFITFLLDNYRILIFTFFFGLILFSSLIIISNLRPSELIEFITIFCGIIIGYSISLINPLSNSYDFFSIYISGLIAISAMLLPGISGSYMLLLLGKYEFILSSINNFKLDVILVFILGAISGVLIFSKLIGWLLNTYYRTTIFLLSGLMLGALNKVWPWQFDGLNYSPFVYTELTSSNNYFTISFIIFILSGILSFLLKSIK